MPNRCKPQSEKRNKGLTLTLKEREYDIIDRLSKYLGITKTDLILTAIKKQYSKKAMSEDHTNDYIAMLMKQIEESEERIRREQENLVSLKEEYQKVVEFRTKVEDEED